MSTDAGNWAREILDKDTINPKWPIVEQHYGCEFPAELKSFYAEINNLLSVPFELAPESTAATFPVDAFCPMGEESRHDFEGFQSYVAIAHDGRAGYYMIDPRIPNSLVNLVSIDDSQAECTGIRLDQFLALARSNRSTR